MRLRLKADGRIVELRDGQEFPLQPRGHAAPADAGSLAVRDLAPPRLPYPDGVRRQARRARRDHPQLGAGQARPRGDRPARCSR